MKIFAFLLTMLFASYAVAQEDRETVVGSGVAKTETRSVDDFHQVQINGSAKLEIVIGETQQLELTTDDNLIELVTTEVVEGKLIIGFKPNTSVSTELGLKVQLQANELTHLSVNGATDATVENASGSEFTLGVNGSGSVTASGKVENVTIQVSGSAQMDLENLESQDVKIKMAGSGTVLTNVSSSLLVTIAGSGSVQYVGEPKVLKSIAGSGEVTKKEAK